MCCFIEPKPCRCCGETPTILEFDFTNVINSRDATSYFVSCENKWCKIRPHSVGDTTKNGAIQKWNDDKLASSSIQIYNEDGTSDARFTFTV